MKKKITLASALMISSALSFAQYPVYDIAQVRTVDGVGDADSLAITCELQGIVYGVNLRPSGIQITIIDSTAGINVFNFTGSFSYNVLEGDSISVQGTIAQYNGLIEIMPDTIFLLSSGNALKSVTLVTTLDESTESELVRIENVVLADPAQWTNSGSGFNVDITNGVDTFMMRIDNDVDIYGTPPPCDSFHVNAIGGQYDGSSPYFEGYQILPRYLADIIEIPMVINAGNNTAICIGDTVQLNASGGATYSWAPSAGLSDTGIANPMAYPDSTTIYTVTAMSGSCIDSAQVTVTVNQPVAAGISITANQNPACSSSPVTFTATPTGGGTNPNYQWMVNGVIAGTDSAEFTTSSLSDGDTVSCLMTSSLACVTGSPVQSGDIIINITTNLTASVNIVADQSSICSGDPVTFTATTAGSGSNPSYQWMVNGVNSGTDSAAFITSSLSDGDTVLCVMTSSASCAIGSPATSNTVVMSVTTSPSSSISISADNNPTCIGNTVTFTASGTGGGTNPSYQWTVNGANAGTDSTIFSSAVLSNGDTVLCIITSSDTCATGSPATSNAITMTVNPLPAVSFSGLDTACTTDSAIDLTGSPPGGAFTGNGVSTGQFDPASAGQGTHTVTYTYTDGNGCTDSTSQNVTVNICTGIDETSAGQSFKIYPNPSSGIYTLSFQYNKPQQVNITIRDVLGRQLLDSEYRSVSGYSSIQVDISKLPDGVYFIHLRTDENAMTTKLLKQ